jgi:GT2 family glycosyltransferase
MKILAHIHTFNDADIIDGSIDALLRQTRPVDGILVVDNGSGDGTLDQPSLQHATVLRHEENLGTSGAVASGFRFALEHEYDWIWILDADSNPEPDALEKLESLYCDWPPTMQERVGFLSCLPHNVPDGLPLHGGLFTPRGLGQAQPAPGKRYHPIDFTIWSGCLYRTSVIRRIGLPNIDYVLDWGEHEYAYRVMKAGFEAVIVQDSIMYHNIRGGDNTLNRVEAHLGPLAFHYIVMPPIRCYYFVRNGFYFGLYVFKEGGRHLLLNDGKEMVKLTGKYLLHPLRHKKLISACVRGIWHGVTGNVEARY